MCVCECVHTDVLWKIKLHKAVARAHQCFHERHEACPQTK